MFNAFETDIAAVQVGVLAPSSAKNHSPSPRIAQSSELNLPGRELPESGFSRAISEFLPFVECKKPSGQAELEAIYRLRHLAYLREGALLPGAPELFRDTYDESDNCCTLGCYVSDRLASSIRIHLGTRSQPCFPAMEAFSDILAPMLDRGLRIIDPTRFVVDATATRLFPRILTPLCAFARLLAPITTPTSSLQQCERSTKLTTGDYLGIRSYANPVCIPCSLSGSA